MSFRFFLCLYAFATAGAILVVIGTVRKNRWGIPFSSPNHCPNCGNPLKRPRRIPKTLSQSLWGGITCDECGMDIDKWGRPIRQRLSPTELAAIKNHPPHSTTPNAANPRHLLRWLRLLLLKPDQTLLRRFLGVCIVFSFPELLWNFFQAGGLTTPLQVLPIWLILAVPGSLFGSLVTALMIHAFFLWSRKRTTPNP
jgi:hypothetical protein